MNLFRAIVRWYEHNRMATPLPVEAAVMPHSGQVIIMSSEGNEVISAEKAKAIYDAVARFRFSAANFDGDNKTPFPGPPIF